MLQVTVIGAGLAGAEAAWQIARLGVPVRLCEMKPQRFSPAHRDPGFAELVCSNSLRSDALSNGVGLLKAEMRRLGSLILSAADATAVPAGSALAVDRVLFCREVTRRLREHPLVTVVSGEVHELPGEGVVVCATGPLTDGDMAAAIRRLTGDDGLHFYDAVAPIVDASTVDKNVAYFASRYGKGDPTDYLNCPLTRAEYHAFWQELCAAETAEMHDFETAPDRPEKLKVFEGCMPVEVMARRGEDTLRFGPMKPVGLPTPDGREPWAVVQLRRENAEGTMYNLVGFQTHLRWGEQKRVFSMIPGLSDASFLRYGVMHRNTYLRSPGFLGPTYAVLDRPTLFFAGQMTGVEGYVESAASGLVAGQNAARLALGLPPLVFPPETMIGGMARYVSGGGAGPFSPMNANFGLLPPLTEKIKGPKSARNEALSARALTALSDFLASADL
ncbi:MAG: methylenetetrahydrofolate--tRNA-(uracil(54)-C(5))-methyltransferase (FADH(2)-oxidizing) TrmFO [Clostridia bacterium]|nr:methylenetetrahydrofolate--tRNA-(uracil(54)-C(5))-methyltransferase (FADH(2)-oxidizing) TrmFO [Clostridia bacterium]